MEEHRIKYIQSGDLQIAASCVTNCDRITEAYYPSSILLFTQTGTLHLETGGKQYEIPKGKFALLRKYTEAKLHKSWTQEEGLAKTYGFGLTNEFIRKVIGKIELPKSKGINQSFFEIPRTEKLNNLMQSLIVHIDEKESIDIDTIEEKTLQALRALAEADENILQIFKEFSINERASIEKLVKHNFLYNIPLATLAKQSGRSLSTFNREFKTIFNDTPHRWIMKERLYYAKNLMEAEYSKPSKVYLESGFEDLAHFSKAFKKQFSITPSDFFKSLKVNS